MSDPRIRSEGEHEFVILLVDRWGMTKDDALDLLRTAGNDLPLAVSAWLEAGEQLAKRRLPGEPLAPTDRLALALSDAARRR